MLGSREKAGGGYAGWGAARVLYGCLLACAAGLTLDLGLLVEWRGLGPVWTLLLPSCRNWGALMGSE